MLSSPTPEEREASATPKSFVDMLPPSVTTDGVSAIMNMPAALIAHITTIRTWYGTKCMKYGDTSFVRKDGRTSASRTTPLGTAGPTRSRAAERMITYDTLFIRPEILVWLRRNEGHHTEQPEGNQNSAISALEYSAESSLVNSP